MSDYLDVIERELKHTEEMMARSRPIRYPGDPEQITTILRISISHPEFTVEQILNEYRNIKKKSARIRVKELLYRHRVFYPDHRKECLQDIDKQFNILLQMVSASSSQEEAKQAFQEYRILRSEHHVCWPVVARLALTEIGRALAKSGNSTKQRILGQKLLEVTDTLLLPHSNQLLGHIMMELARLHGVIETKSMADQVGEMIDQVPEVEGTNENDGGENSSIEEENADLRASLIGLKQELTSFQTNIQTIQIQAQTQAVVTLLKEMNSPANGYLLDNTVQSIRVVTQLISNSWVPEPPEVEGVIYSLKMIFEYFQHIGIQPIRKIGDKEKIGLEDLEHISYTGSEFETNNQKKWIEYRSPGWKYRDQIITRPHATETIISEKGD